MEESMEECSSISEDHAGKKMEGGQLTTTISMENKGQGQVEDEDDGADSEAESLGVDAMLRYQNAARLMCSLLPQLWSQGRLHPPRVASLWYGAIYCYAKTCWSSMSFFPLH